MAKQAPPPPAGGLLAKYGQKLATAVAAHKNDETTYAAVGGLPAGLEGVAELTECKFDVYKDGDLKGEYFFFAQASIITPAYADIKANEAVAEGGSRTKIQGRFTKIGPEPVCDTPTKSRKTMDEHVAWILNELRKLGAPPAMLEAAKMEGLAAAIKKQKPTFTYRTYKFPDTKIENRGGKFFVVTTTGKDVKDGGPFPTEAALKAKHRFVGPSRVNESWGELCERPTDDGDDGVVATGAAAESPPEIVPDDTPVTETADTVDYSTETDLDVLAAAADEGDGSDAAQERLSELAQEAGCYTDAFKNVGTWAEGAEIIKAAQANGPDAGAEAIDISTLVTGAEAEDEDAINKLRELWEASGGTCDEAFDAMSWTEVGEALEVGDPEAEEPALKIGNCGSYKPKTNNPKTKKPYKDPLDVEITAINGDKLDLLYLIDRKTKWTGVPVAEFTPVG